MYTLIAHRQNLGVYQSVDDAIAAAHNLRGVSYFRVLNRRKHVVYRAD